MKKTHGNRIAMHRVKRLLLPLLLVFALIPGIKIEAANLSVTIDTNAERKPISPFIYGINDDNGFSPVKANAVKQTGNFLSTYNWEIDAANSGEQSGNNNFALTLGNPVPAAYPSSFMSNAVESGTEGRFLTIPLSGFAAADAAGTVFEYDTGRFLPVRNRKDGEFFLTPDTADGFVYNDEFIAYMINRFGGRDMDDDSVGITGYFLGREPESYETVFPTLNQPPITAESLSSEIADAAYTVKMIDPEADVFAPSIKNLESFINLSNAPDWETHSDEYSWFIDYFLSAMREAEEVYGERVLDVLDLQFYTEAVSASAVSVLSSSSSSANQARMEAPRLFWDSDYTEASRAAVTYKAYTPLIPILQASIRMNYPGTKLSFSEYAFGGGDNVSGGITVAEALGIFGESGVYMAGLVASQDPEYELAGLKLFTDFDGEGSAFAPVSVQTRTYSDALVYASTDEKNDARLTMVVLNKTDSTMSTRFTINANTAYKDVRIYGFDAASPDIRDMTIPPSVEESSADGDVGGESDSLNNDEDGDGNVRDADSNDSILEYPEPVINNNVFDYVLQPMTAYMFEFTGVWNRTPFTPDSGGEYIAEGGAITDEYGATITEGTITATDMASAALTTQKAPITTVSAPAIEKKTSAEIPAAVKMIGTALIVTVFFGMALVLVRTLKH